MHMHRLFHDSLYLSGNFFFLFSKRFVSGILDLATILACNQLQNATNTTGRVIGFAKGGLLLLSHPTRD